MLPSNEWGNHSERILISLLILSIIDLKILRKKFVRINVAMQIKSLVDILKKDYLKI